MVADWRYYRDRYGWTKAECAAVGLDVYGGEQPEEQQQEVYESEEQGAEP